MAVAPRRFLGQTLAVLALVAAAVGAIVLMRHLRGATTGRRAAGGILIDDAALYDRITGFALGSFFTDVAADVATMAPPGARVLEVGSGPGHLSRRLAGRHGLDVTGSDLDPAMIDRARAGAARSDDDHPPRFLVADVASLAFPNASFDLVVSTLSMHHWADPAASLAEIGRVLRPGGRALIWDLRPGLVPFHANVPDPVELTQGSSLRLVSSTPWRWPFGFHLTQRIALVPDDDDPGPSVT